MGLNNIHTKNYQEDNDGICPTKVEGGEDGRRIIIVTFKK